MNADAAQSLHHFQKALVTIKADLVQGGTQRQVARNEEIAQ